MLTKFKETASQQKYSLKEFTETLSQQKSVFKSIQK